MTRQQLQSHRPHNNTFIWEMTPGNRPGECFKWETDGSRHNDLTNLEKDDSIYYLFFEKKNPTQVTLLRQSTTMGLEITKISAPEELCKGAALPLSTEYIDWICAQFEGAWQASDVFH